MARPQRSALITGITGQDGSFLASNCFYPKAISSTASHKARRLQWHRAARYSRYMPIRTSTGPPGFIGHYGDMSDGASLRKILGAPNRREI